MGTTVNGVHQILHINKKLLERDTGVCIIGQFFMQHFGNLSLELWYCSILQIAGCIFFAFWSTIVGIKTYPSVSP